LNERIPIYKGALTEIMKIPVIIGIVTDLGVTSLSIPVVKIRFFPMKD
jgi:hypothetical protein